MDETFSITDLVIIADRVTSIISEARCKTNLHVRVMYSTSDAGIQLEKHAAIVRAGPGHWKHFDISERDFKFLCWTGLEVEVIGGPAASRIRSAPDAACPARPSGGPSVPLCPERPEEYHGPSPPKVLAVE